MQFCNKMKSVNENPCDDSLVVLRLSSFLSEEEEEEESVGEAPEDNN